MVRFISIPDVLIPTASNLGKVYTVTSASTGKFYITM